MAAESISNQRGKKGKQHAKTESARRSEQDVRSSLGETAEQVTDYVSEGVEEMRSRFRETTRDREGTVVFVALAVGFGIGIALGTSLAQQRRSRSWHERLTAEGVGHRILERLESVVPEGLARYLEK
jgi:hypothetical protein